MSLRAFHLLFIALSVVLAAFFSAWAASQYRAQHDVTYAVTAVVSMAVAGGLVVYGAAFQRKTKHLLALLMVLAAPRAAFACPVCFGQSDSPMASAANLSILVMLIITVGVLAAFGSFFIHLIRRARMATDVSAASGAGPVGGQTEEGTIQC
jgi:hypothetical protein